MQGCLDVRRAGFAIALALKIFWRVHNLGGLIFKKKEGRMRAYNNHSDLCDDVPLRLS